MNTINTLIKWPGGKAREIKHIKHLIPQFERYVEPFFGGGAMFFYLKPQKAIINDISTYLTEFYRLTKEQNNEFYNYLCAYDNMLKSLMLSCEIHIGKIIDIYEGLKQGTNSEKDAKAKIKQLSDLIVSDLPEDIVQRIVMDKTKLLKQLFSNATDKMSRTVKNEAKAPFSDKDLRENLITGFTSGLYMYFRDIYNDILLKKGASYSSEYAIANFYFVREYCYGSMFRYNSKGEFNIPYGGMSYNRKDFTSKIKSIFSQDTQSAFSNTEIFCGDFEKFLSKAELTENDFMFLDPPYDTDFSDYEGKDFTKEDQKRLSEALKKTKAKFILIIKNTDYIYSLYEGHFNILCFDKTYTYNVRSRNERKTEHLIITNIAVNE